MKLLWVSLGGHDGFKNDKNLSIDEFIFKYNEYSEHSVDVVIPFFNEENIELTMNHKKLEKFSILIILYVNNGSIDNTLWS